MIRGVYIYHYIQVTHILLYSRGTDEDNIENTSSVFPYKQPARTTAETTASLLVCDVTVIRENVLSARCIATVRARTTENTAHLLSRMTVYWPVT
jgi:hypothetical protein